LTTPTGKGPATLATPGIEDKHRGGIQRLGVAGKGILGLSQVIREPKIIVIAVSDQGGSGGLEGQVASRRRPLGWG
jgi:hypothetical protein